VRPPARSVPPATWELGPGYRCRVEGHFDTAGATARYGPRLISAHASSVLSPSISRPYRDSHFITDDCFSISLLPSPGAFYSPVLVPCPLFFSPLAVQKFPLHILVCPMVRVRHESTDLLRWNCSAVFLVSRLPGMLSPGQDFQSVKPFAVPFPYYG